MNKTLVWAVVAVIVVGGISFYGGISYANSQAPSAASRAAGAGQFAGRTGTGARGGAGGFATGQIVSSGNGSITIQLASGSTQIVVMGTSTQILKSSVGSMSDLTSGTSVVVTGSANSDGSLTAQSIQIRPAGMTGGFGGARGGATPTPPPGQ